MKVLIDADGCPVISIAVKLCIKYKVECILLCDTAHEIQYIGATSYIFDKGKDSVDFAIANRTKAGDVVITQDYGLASMCLAKGATVIHQDGWQYTLHNIDALLMQRYISSEYRSAGGRTKGPAKRSVNQNKVFTKAFEQTLQQMSQG